MQAFKWLYEKEKPSKADVIKMGNVYTPYSSVASRYLYRVVDYGFTKMKTEEMLYVQNY